jgi:hypothetical protein
MDNIAFRRKAAACMAVALTLRVGKSAALALHDGARSTNSSGVDLTHWKSEIQSQIKHWCHHS